MTLARVLRAELLKLRRSRVTWLSLLAYAMGPLIGGLFLWIAQEPERAAELGLLGTKANLVGVTADWPAYLTLLVQTTGLAGMLLLSVVAAWIFGREYAEGTARNMYALPIGRHWFVVAKLIVVLGWIVVATALLLAEAFGIGLLLDLPGLSTDVAMRGMRDVVLAAGVAFLLVPPVAWLATLGRGYLPPLGFAILMLVLGNVLGATGWGRWFPWSIVPLFAGVAGPREASLAAGSLLVLAVTAGLGVAATIAQITWSDTTQ